MMVVGLVFICMLVIWGAIEAIIMPYLNYQVRQRYLRSIQGTRKDP